MAVHTVMAGFIATIRVTCERCGYAFTYDQLFGDSATADNRKEAMRSVAKTLADLRAPWIRADFRGIKARRCPGCGEYQSWMAKAGSTSRNPLLGRLKGLLGRQKPATRPVTKVLPDEQRRRPTIRIRPDAHTARRYNETELKWTLGIEEGFIFRPVRGKPPEQVVLILEEAPFDQTETLVEELRGDQELLDHVVQRLSPILTADEAPGEWFENTMGEMVRSDLAGPARGKAAHVLSAIGKPAVEELIRILTNLLAEQHPRGIQYGLVAMVAKAIGRIGPDAIEAVPIVIEALDAAEECSRESGYRAVESDVQKALVRITQKNYRTYGEWRSWWASED